MIRCQTCSAPLPANTQICRYCGVRNDVDIHGKHRYRPLIASSGRLCPECDSELKTIELVLDRSLHIERCATCYGLFFDIGEVEAMMEAIVSPVFAVNPDLLASINSERYPSGRPVRYLKCPVCRVLMNRVSFGHRSGVVVDRCKSHGLWLDGGEISHLLEWRHAGGQLLHEQKQAERKAGIHRSPVVLPSSNRRVGDADASNVGVELLSTVADLMLNLFSGD